MQREGPGGGPYTDVHPGRINPESQSDQRGTPGHSFSASAISEINKKLDDELGRFARRQLGGEYPYLIIDARYEKVRENGVIGSRALLEAIGIDWEGRRQMLGVEMANRESATSWKEFVLGLKRRGLRGVIFAVSDDHPGLKRAVMEVLPEAFWQGCYVHFLRNAADHLPRKNCRRLSDRTVLALRSTQRRGSSQRSGGLAASLAGKIPETLRMGRREHRGDAYLLPIAPREHHKHLKSTSMLERLNQELKRRTYVLRIFPNEESALGSFERWPWKSTKIGSKPSLPEHGDASRTTKTTPAATGSLRRQLNILTLT